MISVPKVGMTDVWRRLDQAPIWLLKIDTEGGEGDILEGMPEEMLRATEHIVVEYHDNLEPGVSSRCRSLLAASGFEFTERVHPWDEGILYARRVNGKGVSAT